MIEKPKSFQEYSEIQENEDISYSDGLYSSLYKKLNETRKEIQDKGILDDPEITEQVNSLYNSRVFNLELERQRQESKSQEERTKDAIEVAQTIVKMRKDAGLPEDPDLSAVIEGNQRDLQFYQKTTEDLANALEINENHPRQKSRLEDGRIMGRVEQDAYKEKIEREREL